MASKPTLLLKNPEAVITCDPVPGDLIGRMAGKSVLIAGDQILAVAPYAELVAQYDMSAADVLDCSGKILAPGFVDSHTHVVFGGSRVKEYAMKLTMPAAEVRAAGIPTGITASMAMTRAAAEEELYADAADRLKRMLAYGTTTVESKSGYGLALESELKMLRVNRMLSESEEQLPHIVSTFLGAHAFPPDVQPQDYVDEIIEEMIPAVVELNLARFCDVYIDEGYFNLDQTRRILWAAREAGLLLKIHADQYAALGGAELAAEMAVVSVDHLNYTTPETMAKLASAGVVGVLMPLIDFAVRHPRPFDAAAMRAAGMKLALATDICPGGWTESMQLVMQFACRQYGFTPEAAFYASTVGGAQALALDDRGRILPAQRADIQIWDVPQFEDIIYRLGSNAVSEVVLNGRIVGLQKG